MESMVSPYPYLFEEEWRMMTLFKFPLMLLLQLLYNSENQPQETYEECTLSSLVRIEGLLAVLPAIILQLY